MTRFGKRIILAIILVELIFLPILLISAKKQQETKVTIENLFDKAQNFSYC